jgi:YidC/Oxa1 family membrane protein insertase
MKLQKEHGNPLFGCLPMLVQIPLFISLYHVLNGFAPKKVHGSYTPYTPKALDGLSLSTASKVAHAKILGVSMSAAFLSPGSLLHYVGSSLTGTRVLSVVLIVIMAATTFITQRQIFGSNSAQMDKSAQTTQRIMLYLSPAMLFIFGFRMPIGVLLYWLTTNVWSMGQQFVVLRRMPPLAAVIPPPAKRVVQVREKPAAGAAQAEPEETPAAPSVRPPRQPRARVVPATDGPALSDTRPPAPRRGKPVKKRGKNQRKGGRR